MYLYYDVIFKDKIVRFTSKDKAYSYLLKNEGNSAEKISIYLDKEIFEDDTELKR